MSLLPCQYTAEAFEPQESNKKGRQNTALYVIDKFYLLNRFAIVFTEPSRAEDS
jgi:hypothetical protein